MRTADVPPRPKERHASAPRSRVTAICGQDVGRGISERARTHGRSRMVTALGENPSTRAAAVVPEKRMAHGGCYAVSHRGDAKALSPPYAFVVADLVFGPRQLGASGLAVSALGVGTNRWGGQGAVESELAATYSASLDAGVFFFDSAEVYTAGRSERLLGRCSREDPRPVVLASKFAPYPTRLRATQLDRSLDATLARMGTIRSICTTCTSPTAWYASSRGWIGWQQRSSRGRSAPWG